MLVVVAHLMWVICINGHVLRLLRLFVSSKSGLLSDWAEKGTTIAF
jgi:hypothetical protein